MLTTTNQNTERMNVVFNKSYDLDIMEELFYRLQDQMILKCNYEAALATKGVTKERIEAKINSTRYNIYKTIAKIIQNGGNQQLNSLAISFLNEELRRFNNVRFPKRVYNQRKMNCHLIDKKSHIINIKQMISKLKLDARIY